MLALEIIDKIFSYLSYSEIYRIRSVCKSWKSQCEHHLYLSFKLARQKIYVKIGESGSSTLVDMVPSSYDDENLVIEFKPALEGDDSDVYLNQDSSTRTQIQFSEWCEREVAAQTSELLMSLTLIERAQVLFHLTYNPPMEQVYELKIPAAHDNGQLHYAGDKGMIVTYSCTLVDQRNESTAPVLHFRGIEDDDIQDSFASLFDDVLASNATAEKRIRLRVHSIHANLSWLLSGINLDIVPEPIYPRRYQALADTLIANGINKHVCAYSEPVLKYIMEEQESHQDTIQNMLTLPENSSWRERLQSSLKSLGIDPRIIWKYTFAKNYMIKGQPRMAPEDVAKVIKHSEEDWVVKKLDLVRRLRSFK